MATIGTFTQTQTGFTGDSNSLRFVTTRLPLHDAQHPHDLFMALGATYRLTRGADSPFVGIDLVGAPPLGPPPLPAPGAQPASRA